MIQGTTLRDALISASNTLESQKQRVDALNVFPVPDGDTGTNMSMTIGVAARELARLDDPTVTAVADKTASAMLRGARGNSGVILSLLFRGFSKGLKEKKTADGADLARALGLGVEAAYKAVMKPTEGTILTVAREAAAAGKTAAAAGEDTFKVWDAICAEAEASLKRTPDLLPTLKKAGVVDAGGQGLCIVLRAMQRVFEGGEVVQGTATTSSAATQVVSAAGSFETDIRFTYCTEFIVSRSVPDKDPMALRAFLESIGDCVVVVDDDEIIKVHVHTNDPGRALHEAIEYGQFETVKVENMRIQHANASWVAESGQIEEQPPKPVDPEEPFGFVAVAAGDGIRDLFHELGCAQVVSGGQTMNPSTDDILQAIEATPAKVVYVFPNNKNIILAAEQTIPLASREVHVLPTRSVPQGVSAILAFDPDAEVKENLLAMNKAAESISVGQVTFAVRDSVVDNKPVKKGQLLAMEGGKLAFADNDLTHAVTKLVRNITIARQRKGKESSILTLIYGSDVTEEQAQKVEQAIRERVDDDIEITLISGGQPVYYYILSVE
ncbi:MAG: DAK2 domain-containing protein [Clostridia bacterium]|nr:DAK2 domain-containing protein [Clostridia bacterium]